MESVETREKKDKLLKGRSNFLPWMTKLEALLSIDGVVERDRDEKLIIVGTTEKEKEKYDKTGRKYIIENCSDKVMHSINPQDKFAEMFAKLNASYGYAYVDPGVIKQELRHVKFHPSKDPTMLLNDIDSVCRRGS
jgi:hypothetical protein